MMSKTIMEFMAEIEEKAKELDVLVKDYKADLEEKIESPKI